MQFKIHVLNQIRGTSNPRRRKAADFSSSTKKQLMRNTCECCRSCPENRSPTFFKKSTVVQLPGRGCRDLQETVTQWWLSDLSHINLPPLTRAELSSAVFTLPLSLSSSLRVISSAIWSIASQMKNALRVTNLFTSSQKDVCVHHRGRLFLWRGSAGSSLSPWLLFVSAKLRASRTNYPLHFTESIWPAAGCTEASPMFQWRWQKKQKKKHRRSAAIKTSAGQSQQHFISWTYFPLWSANEARKVQGITH